MRGELMKESEILHQVRINEKGQTQVNCGDGWEDCSYEEYQELLEGGYDLLLESESSCD